MAKTYKGSLTLEWYNKQKSIIIQNDDKAFGKYEKSVYINWINREESLFYEIIDEQGKGDNPYWVNINDIRVKESRPLVFKKTFIAQPKNKQGTLEGTDVEYKIIETHEDNHDIHNILIKGDNLLALNSLKKILSNRDNNEKFKCIYIDPPYNTKAAFVNFDDNLAHSQWLSLMRDRLYVLYELLSDDGVILISINDKEVAYLKILCDEIFGRENFLTTFVWKTDGNFDNQARIKVCHEYILLYAKDESLFDEPSIKDPNIPPDSKLFKETIQNTIVKNGPKNPPSDIILPKGFPADFEEGIISARNDKWPIYKADLKIKNYQLTNEVSAYSGWSSKALAEEFINNNFTSIFDQKGQETKFVLTKTGAIEAIKQRSEASGYVVSVLENMGSTQKMSAELKTIDVKFDFPKPEGLISYLLKICSKEGDYILDCFGGSGTTFSVAHKLKRRWVGIELGNQIDNFIIPRLKKVIAGIDNIGISQSVNWQGGGSFKYYHLGPSIIQINKDGTIDFNWSLGKKFIEESLLLSYDYQIDNSISFDADKLFKSSEAQPAIGIQKIGTKSRIAVISLNEPKGKLALISFDEIQSLYKTLKSKYSPEYINIFTNRGVEIAYDSKPDDLEIIKVPHAIFAELEK